MFGLEKPGYKPLREAEFSRRVGLGFLGEEVGDVGEVVSSRERLKAPPVRMLGVGWGGRASSEASWQRAVLEDGGSACA